ncbi:putative DNA-directed RNA polymerase subunit delta [Melissococcus plutonius]|uniref:Probable DNA-directed RNA polymerase subunit delta n=1 Tax=Melissococcus plutonius (strain ATCC 35311 / DSM 29964 / CIP 104052 / LMG 20360 / NCIMB 702443) TaxID=940190 RepID=F3YAE5_MELPT|nr:DNA-directed RNA polymerase subunit delta [Melissococcus plutonius]AIM24952.1 putative DNA-directed RNA polymerase subunit delta [Melissococcus plutonius S1]BAK21473.1 DNA-directed RNA polymerase delta subunit [Melissococcus plutonius ATCC 35311]KMT25099.1 putative DNA-directed RNA polymerase subunit delta [Melissococcus plutonius]KMT26736.1 putative DNA-directed RNA polymerase subunit delta [Melissococcus plutonius]KMT27986.1 putative DNA-directed RNA polymerase subunit delta [Melissococcu
MEIKAFDGLNKKELSMIEVAHAILEQRGDVMDFSDLVNDIQNYLETSDSEIRDSLAQFYTDLNIDGSFISLGDNRWGLRSWYPIDSINEEVTHGLDDDDEEETIRRRKRKKVNAFIMDTDDDDAIDYNDDDPEDSELDENDNALFDDDEEDGEIKAYNSDLQEIGADADEEDELPEIEENLSIIDDEEIDPEFDENGEYPDEPNDEGPDASDI